MMEVVATTGLLELKIMQSSSQIITTRLDAFPVAQPTVSKQHTNSTFTGQTYFLSSHQKVCLACKNRVDMLVAVI